MYHQVARKLNIVVVEHGYVWVLFWVSICSTPAKNIEHVNIVFVGAEQVPWTLLVLKKYQHPCSPFLIHVVPEF